MWQENRWLVNDNFTKVYIIPKTSFNQKLPPMFFLQRREYKSKFLEVETEASRTKDRLEMMNHMLDEMQEKMWENTISIKLITCQMLRCTEELLQVRLWAEQEEQSHLPRRHCRSPRDSRRVTEFVEDVVVPCRTHTLKWFNLRWYRRHGMHNWWYLKNQVEWKNSPTGESECKHQKGNADIKIFEGLHR